ncbi:MAG: hypothetical protein R3343_06570 [Nitriliruptorales bacterium]|nr:hypothetical protein [Nitriliruptorales bacterium]
MSATIRDRLETALPSNKTRTEAARERARETAEEVRVRASEAAEKARSRAADVADDARDRAEELANESRDRAEDLADWLWPWLRRLLDFLSSLFSSVTEQGRVALSRVEDPPAVKRRGRWKTAAWFAGGFTLGAATGWILHARLQGEAQPPEGLYATEPSSELSDSPYGEDAEAIDARRQNLTSG